MRIVKLFDDFMHFVLPFVLLGLYLLMAVLGTSVSSWEKCLGLVTLALSFYTLGKKRERESDRSMTAKVVTICLVMAFVLFAQVARAEGLPPSQLPPTNLPASVLPKACDCNPCTCNPADCKCAGCEVGCHNKGATTEAFVGFEPNQAPFPQKAPVAQGFHTEYRQVCNGTSCPMVAVSVPDQAPTYAPAPAYGASAPTYSSCSSCGTQGSQAQGGMSCGAGSASGRRLFGRVFRGRCR